MNPRYEIGDRVMIRDIIGTVVSTYETSADPDKSRQILAIRTDDGLIFQASARVVMPCEVRL